MSASYLGPAPRAPDILIECMSNLWGWALPLRARSVELNNWQTFAAPGLLQVEEGRVEGGARRDELPTPLSTSSLTLKNTASAFWVSFLTTIRHREKEGM